MKMLGAAKSAHRNEAGVVDELVSKQPRPTSGQTTKEEYDDTVGCHPSNNMRETMKTAICILYYY